jgi:hypothetical protein
MITVWGWLRSPYRNCVSPFTAITLSRLEKLDCIVEAAYRSIVMCGVLYQLAHIGQLWARSGCCQSARRDFAGLDTNPLTVELRLLHASRTSESTRNKDCPARAIIIGSLALIMFWYSNQHYRVRVAGTSFVHRRRSISIPMTASSTNRVCHWTLRNHPFP